MKLKLTPAQLKVLVFIANRGPVTDVDARSAHALGRRLLVTGEPGTVPATAMNAWRAEHFVTWAVTEHGLEALADLAERAEVREYGKTRVVWRVPGRTGS